MPLGIGQTNNILHLTVDAWRDEVFLNETSYPAGYFAAEVLNMDVSAMQEMVEKGGAVSYMIEQFAFADREQFAALQPQAKSKVAAFLDALWNFPPYSYLNRDKEDEVLEVLFGAEALDTLLDPASELRTFFFRYLTACFSIPLGIYHFGWACDYFISEYLSRVKRRDETHFAVAAHDCFNSDGFWEEVNAAPLPEMEVFTVTPRLFTTFVFARHPKDEKKMVFVSRHRFETAIEFYCYDLLNGMHHGHAPSICRNCGHVFLTTNAHVPMYCDGNDPERPEFTCRQIGASQHLSESNDDHPIYQLYRTRCNTIRQHEKRKKITHEVREAAIRLAEKYRDKALMDRAYAQSRYETDMETEHIYAEVGRQK